MKLITHSLSNAESKNRWSYISTPVSSLQGLALIYFTFTYFAFLLDNAKMIILRNIRKWTYMKYAWRTQEILNNSLVFEVCKGTISVH
jgi:hypothetical protein